MAAEEVMLDRATAPGFKEAWEGFVRRQNNIGPFYTYTFLEHCVSRAETDGGQYHSFLVRWKGSEVGIVPLVMEITQKGKLFSSAGGFNTFYAPYISQILGSREQKLVMDQVFAEIDRLAAENGVVACWMTIDPYQSLISDRYNWLCRYGYIDCTIATNVIDLTNDLETLKAQRRKSYKSLINNGLREFKFCVVDNANYDRSVFDAYVAMHEKAAGRKTRSQSSFEKQDAALQKGEATLIAASLGEVYVHLAFFHHLNGYVYYSSSAKTPDYDLPRLPTGPPIIWYAIEHFKLAGFRYFETGWQPLGPQLFDPVDRKHLDIAFFKEGFGGRNTALFRGIKYYDREFMRMDIEGRVRDMIKRWP